MAIQTYNPSSVTLLLALLYEVTDFSPTDMITLSKDSPNFSTSKGGAGGVERIHNADLTYTLQISLSQTSPSNQVLNSLSILDNVSKRAVFPIYSKDSSGNSVFFCSSCWIEEPAEASYSLDIETRIWRIKCSDVVFGLSGNETDRNVLEQVGQLSSLLGQFGANRGIF